MIDGIPESASAAYSIAETIFLFRAYSVRYTALPTPSGRTIINVAKTIYSEFRISGRIPTLPDR